MVLIDVDESLIDVESPAGVTDEGRAFINDALYNLGSNVEIKRMAACPHTDTYVSGEYRRCTACDTIVGNA